MNKIASMGGYTIATLLDKKRNGVCVVAFCPICDRAEESADQGTGPQQAAVASITKVRQHMRQRHRIKDSH